MDRQITPPEQVTSPTWGRPPSCKQALRSNDATATRTSKNEKKTNWLNRQNNNFGRASHFLCISLPFFHDDVKMPKCAFYGERKKATAKFYFFLAPVFKLWIALSTG